MQDTVYRERESKGEPRMRCIDNMEKWTGTSFDKLLRETKDEGIWSRLIHEATNPRSEYG